MKIEIDVPRGAVRRLLYFFGLPLAVIMAAALVARAYETTWIGTGQQLSATKLKADLDEVQSRLTVLENRTFTSVQLSKDFATSNVVPNWAPLPNLTLNFVVAAGNAGVDLSARGTLVGGGAQGGAGKDTVCEILLLLDNQPLTTSTDGSAIVTGVLDSNANSASSFITTTHSGPLAPGMHILSASIALQNGLNPAPSASCEVFGLNENTGVLTLSAAVR